MLEGERISVSDWKVLVCSGPGHQELGRPNPSLLASNWGRSRRSQFANKSTGEECCNPVGPLRRLNPSLDCVCEGHLARVCNY